MVDDKNDPAPDPWADIDEGGEDQAADGFTFSFDTSSDVEGKPAVPQAEDEIPFAPDLVGSDPGPSPADADDAPIIRIDAAAETAADADPFADLAADGGPTAEDLSAWLEEPEASVPGEPPLAVFPTGDSDESASSTEADVSPGADVAAWDEVHETTAADDEHVAAGSSHVQIGTGFSGIVSPSEIDPSHGDGAGAGDDWPGGMGAESPLDDFAVDEQSGFEASGFDGLGEVGESHGGPGVETGDVVEAGAAAGAAVTPVPDSPRRQASRRTRGGIGSLIGIVLGGLMALPITYAILIWGFQRDPFKLAGLMPEQVAFLLPAKFQPGSSRGPSSAAPRSPLDDLPQGEAAAAPPVPAEPEPDEPKPVEPMPVEPKAVETASVAPGPGESDGAPSPGVAPDAVVKMREPAAEPEPAPAEPPVPAPAPKTLDDIFATAPSPAPVAPPRPEPLDLTALEEAAGEAVAAHEAVAAANPEDVEGRKKLLVAWYKRLAAVAEQWVLLEKVAADTGRTVEKVPEPVDSLFAGLAADADAQAELGRLSRMWLASRKRPADGAMLLATFEGSRRVGPYWSTRVTIDGEEPRDVAVISRVEPVAAQGEKVLVTGVLFDGDVVWASDCRPVAGKPAAAEDLF